MVNTLLMATSIGKAKGHKPIAWRGSPNSYKESDRIFVVEREYYLHLVDCCCVTWKNRIIIRRYATLPYWVLVTILYSRMFLLCLWWALCCFILETYRKVCISMFMELSTMRNWNTTDCNWAMIYEWYIQIHLSLQ